MTQNKRKIKNAVKRKTEKTIQIIAGVVVLVVAAWILWAITSSQKPTNPATASGAPGTGVVEKKTYAASPAMSIDKTKKYTAC